MRDDLPKIDSVPIDGLVEAHRKERRAKRILYTVLTMVCISLLGLGFLQYDNYRNDEIERLASQEVQTQLQELCQKGAIDCEGTRGLPGPRGASGVGITGQRCDFTTGRFEFTYTSGRTRQIGDCVAEDGATGPRGPRGPQGLTGEKGDRGPRGLRGQRGKPGKLLLGQKPREVIEVILP